MNCAATHLNSGKLAEVGVFPFLIKVARLPIALKPLGHFGIQKDPFRTFLTPVSSQPFVKPIGFLKTALTFLELVQYLCIMLLDGALYFATT